MNARSDAKRPVSEADRAGEHGSSPTISAGTTGLKPAEVDAVIASPAFRTFSNALRILRSIDLYELEGSGLLSRLEWNTFRDHPESFFIHASDAQAAAIWMVVERRARMTQKPTASPDAGERA